MDINQVRKVINEDNSHNGTTPQFVKTFIKKAKVHYKCDKTNTSTDNRFIAACYSRTNAVFGYDDYKNHSNDGKKELKKLMAESLVGHVRTLQLSNYYNQDGTLVEEILVSGYDGGWECNFIYKNGKSYFDKK